ncbi:discoidin domain-containing protein, partial [Steroidobacter sp.]|uniref:discoidin domain-containing protein n=1 Tax=Steroidobacter sp. TaxID=1978227 RepID=UPI001A63F862
MRAAARLLGLWMLMAAAPSPAQQLDKLGFFVGEATPATAAPSYRSFVSKVQQTPNSTNVFVDYREPIWSAGTYDPKWRNNATWAAGNLAQLCSVDYLNRLDADGRPTLIPIVSVGLTDDPTAYQLNLPANHPNRGVYSENAAVAMMNAVAAGKYDDDDIAAGRYRVWPAIFDAFKNKGFRKIYLRIGWEQNGNWYGWQVRSEATRVAYIAAWRHVADLAHKYAASNGMVIETMWSPSASYANYGLSEESSYPGDSYVDVIAPTHYSPVWNPTRSRDKTAYHDWTSGANVALGDWLANAANRRVVWDYPAADYWNPKRGWGLPAAIEFALARSKRFALSETGTGAVGVTRNGGGPIDDGDYGVYLGERLSAAIAQGLQLEVVEIWPQATGSDRLTFLSGARPQEANAWKEFGVMLAAAESPRNLAKGRKAYPSSTESSSYAASKITDGSTATAWRSVAGTEKQWIYVDLGQRYSISRVRLTWDAGHATEYTIQTMVSTNTWVNVYKTSSGDGGVDDIRGLSTVGRYIRVFATKR